MDKICYYAFGVKAPFYLQYIVLGLIFVKPLKKIINFEIVRLFLIFLPFIFSFAMILRNDPFFLSDDFAHLKLVSQNSYIGILKMAMTSEGIWVGHRIILGFWLFKMIFDLFKVNPVPYQVVIFLINLTNGILFYILIGRILKSKKIAAFVAFIFGFFYVSWISNIHEILALAFVLASLNLFLAWFKKFNTKSYIFSLLFYTLALMAKEITFLLFPVMVLLATKENKILKKSLKYLVPFLAIFILYTVFFARGFLYYFDLPRGVGYNMFFSLPLILSNLIGYFSQIFSALSQGKILPVFILILIFLYIIPKNSKSIPFLVSYLILLSPALLFSGRAASYYNYIPLAFFLIGIGIILEGLFFETSKLNNTLLKDTVIVAGVVFFAVGLFGLNKKMMDKCFLIQYPRKNEVKQAYLGLIRMIDESARSGQLKEGLEIKLSLNQDMPPEAMESQVLEIFLGNSEARRYTYSYNPEKGTISVR